MPQFVPAEQGTAAYYALDNLWGVAGGSDALVPFVQGAQGGGYETGLPTFQNNGTGAGGSPFAGASSFGGGVSGSAGGGGGSGYSASTTSAQDTRAGRDANAQNTSGGLIGGPSLASGGSGPSTSGLGEGSIISFGGINVGAAPRTPQLAQIEESQSTYRTLAYAAAGMSAVGLLLLLTRR